MNYFKIYADFLKKFLQVKRPLFVVLDAFNGASGIVATEIFSDYPLIQLICLNNLPDGDFPAHGPNPLLAGALKELCQKVVKQKADLGITLDFGESWLNVRLSNNEPLLRFTAGAKTPNIVARLLKECGQIALQIR